MKIMTLPILAGSLALASAQGFSTVPPPTGNVVTVTSVWQTNTVTVYSTNVMVQPEATPTTNPPIFSGPLAQALAFATTGTNWIAAGYAIDCTDTHQFGAGISLAYKLSDYVLPTLGIDWFDNHFWMPSGQLQLQAPLTLFGKVTVVPFVRGGIATPISGAGANNGTAVGIAGTGAALRLDFLGSGAFWQKSDIVGDYELWTGLPQQHQIRLGFAYKF